MNDEPPAKAPGGPQPSPFTAAVAEPGMADAREIAETADGDGGGDGEGEGARASDAEDHEDLVFDTLWKRVLEAWDEDKVHAAALDYALRKQLLPDLAGRYRALKDDVEKGARAQKKIDGIVAAATHMLMSIKTPPRTKTPWHITASVGVACAFVIFWLAYKIFFRGH